jgi:hypothetical protein
MQHLAEPRVDGGIHGAGTRSKDCTMQRSAESRMDGGIHGAGT